MTGPVGSIVVEPKREEGGDMTGRLFFRPRPCQLFFKLFK